MGFFSKQKRIFFQNSKKKEKNQPQNRSAVKVLSDLINWTKSGFLQEVVFFLSFYPRLFKEVGHNYMNKFPIQRLRHVSKGPWGFRRRSSEIPSFLAAL